jgi:arabinofuranan 3-O-arabinosyltransferase
VDLLRLRSPAPEPATAAGGGRVVDPGELGRSSVNGVRLALDGPSWLVLGQSFNQGWRASCDGRSLGAPRVVDAYANAWPVPASCRSASFTFQPQNGVRWGYVISGAVCALILLFMLIARLMGRRMRQEELSREPIPEPAPRGMPLATAIAISIVVTVPLMIWFALRMGVVIGPVLAYVLWRGIGPGPLVAGSAFLLVVMVPLMYLIIGPANQGGYSFGYSNSLLLVHWVAITALFLLALAAMRMLGAARGRYSR